MAVCWVPFGYKKKSRNAHCCCCCCCPTSGPLYRPPGIPQDCQCTGNKYPPCVGIKQPPANARTRKKEAQTTRAGRKDSSRYSLCSGESVLLSRWLYSLCRCPLLSSLSDPARCSACLVTGRPVWGCNNPAPSAHAPDSMLLKVHYK